MHISKINDEPFSEKLKKKILQENKQFLTSAKMKSSANPYNYNSTNDKITIFFDKNDEQKGVGLPFTSNAISISNITDYRSTPKFNYLRNLFLGTLKSVQPQKLNEFFDQMKLLNITEIIYKTKLITTQDPDFNKKNDTAHVLNIIKKTHKAEGNSLDEKISHIQGLFLPQSEFEIDPKSYVRVEKRSKKNTYVYQVSLSYRRDLGLSGVPGITTEASNRIQVKVLK